MDGRDAKRHEVHLIEKVAALTSTSLSKLSQPDRADVRFKDEVFLFLCETT